MINTLAKHKLHKLSTSKMIIIFLIAGVFIALIVFLPIILMSASNLAAQMGIPVADQYYDIVEFFGALVALAIGVLLWRQDQKDGTLLTFLARPVSRTNLLLAKLLGGIYGLIILLLVSTILYFIAHFLFFDFSMPIIFLIYLLQVLIKWITYLAFGLFFASIVNPLFAAFLVICYFAVGTIGSLLSKIPYETTETIGKVIKVFVMDTDYGFELSQILQSDVSSLSYLYTGIGYYLLWAVMLLSASVLMFSRREFYNQNK